ncbi:hypothetical protein AAC387_Pa10g1944 [Persea americana]
MLKFLPSDSNLCSCPVYSGFNSKILYLGSSSSCLIQICFPRSNSSCCCRVPISSMLGGLVYQKTFL